MAQRPVFTSKLYFKYVEDGAAEFDCDLAPEENGLDQRVCVILPDGTFIVAKDKQEVSLGELIILDPRF